MSFHTFISPPHPNYRYSQASYRGSFFHAWWVWAAKPGETLRDYIEQRGWPERGNSGGGRQEDAGETWKRERHYLCPYCHEHGERAVSSIVIEKTLWSGMFSEHLLLPIVICKVLLCWTGLQSFQRWNDWKWHQHCCGQSPSTWERSGKIHTYIHGYIHTYIHMQYPSSIHVINHDTST